MAFGQRSGPPAAHRQVERLLGLLHDAGHVDFRDARGPMGFTQRQAGGRFTRDEADAFIEQLERGATSDDTDDDPTPVVPLTANERALQAMPAEAVAAELQRRGWAVLEP